MNPNRALIERFYQAFSGRDAGAMAACYHPQAQFSDPVFTDLRGPRIAAMWDMLCHRAGDDFRIEIGQIDVTAEHGSAHWEAWYTFSGSGRKVHNRIDASFAFRDGLIVRHQDRFSLYRWSSQALGWQGLLLGWLPPIHQQIRAQAARGLAEWMADSSGAKRSDRYRQGQNPPKLR